MRNHDPGFEHQAITVDVPAAHVGVAEPPAVPASPRSVTHTPAARFGPEVPIMVLIREWVAQGPISTDLSTYPPRAAAA